MYKECIMEFQYDQEALQLLAELFKILGDPTRLRIVYLLSLIHI